MSQGKKNNLVNLVDRLGVGHLPVYTETNVAGRLVHELVTPAISRKVRAKIISAKRLDPELKLLPVIESAEVVWNERNLNHSRGDFSFYQSVLDRSLVYVGGFIQSEEDPTELYLLVSSNAIQVGRDVVLLDDDQLESLTTIRGYHRRYKLE